MYSKYDIVIVRGAPGIGKSTLCQFIKNELLDGITIEIDSIRTMFNSNPQNEQFKQVLDITYYLIEKFANLGRIPIIIPYTFSGVSLIYFENLITEKYTYKIITLYSDNDTLNNRLNERIFGFKNFQFSKEVNLELINDLFRNDLKIDTTNLTTEMTAKIIYQTIV